MTTAPPSPPPATDRPAALAWLGLAMPWLNHAVDDATVDRREAGRVALDAHLLSVELYAGGVCHCPICALGST